MELISRIIDGEYPDYEQIIPKSFKTKAVVSSERLLSDAKTASFFSKENANNVKLQFKNNSIIVEASSSQLGTFKSEIEGDVSGEEVEIGFNAKYLMDAINGLGEEELVFNVVGKLNPGLIKSTSKENDIVYIIMPLRS
jgi:DNA polymerase III subunit beta